MWYSPPARTSPAPRIARDLVESAQARSDPGRAGCVTRVGPVHSTYRWRESIQDEPEVLLVVKTVSTRYPELEMRLKSLHAYPVPEIIALPLTSGSADYVSWLQGAVE
ncbi:MAG: divalent-cation tolerance protein CutA [Steroidobacteraceae bacterium]